MLAVVNSLLDLLSQNNALMSSLLLSIRNFFLVRIPFYVLPIILLLFIAGIYFFGLIRPPVEAATIIPATQHASCITNMNIVRLKDYRLTKPILLADVNIESEDLEQTKGVVIDMIHKQQQLGNVSSVSVYLRKFSDGSWITINGDEKYAPGSLMKVPILITILKQAETNPSLLDKKVVFYGNNASLPHQNFVEDSLIVGTKYSTRELLKRMIVDSDNNATAQLSANLNVEMVKKLFTDLNLREPNVQQKDYFITASDCGKFLRILYNSSYLSHTMSEYALDLLTQSKFKNGLSKGLTEGVRMAHKFGESGETGKEMQLHEEGIVYLDNNPYLVVVMTKGKDFEKQGACIAEISKVIYNRFNGSNLN